ncbi:hypothetical protein ACFU46_12255 [Streptomyces griseoincarnatus]
MEADEASDAECCSIGAACVYAVYDPAARTCAVALAGQPPAVTGGRPSRRSRGGRRRTG